MGHSGTATVEAVSGRTLLVDHGGQSAIAVREGHKPNAEHIALKFSSPTRRFRRESWARGLRLTAA